MLLTPREQQFWQRALSQSPIFDDFDEVETSTIVLRMQQIWNNPSNEDLNQFWSQISTMVRQLQSARDIVRRSVQPIEKFTTKANSFRVVPPTVDTNPQQIQNHVPLPSPLAPPPALKTTAGSDFCDSDIRLTLLTMERHKTNAKIQERGCNVIVDFLRDLRMKRANRVAVQNQWKCESCTSMNPKSTSICSVCAIAAPDHVDFSTTTEVPEVLGTKYLQELGALNLIVDAIREYGENENVVESAVFALAQMLHEDENLIYSVASQGGINDMVRAMPQMYKNSEVLTQCLGILASPALGEDSITRIDGDLFIVNVVAAMQNFPSSSRLTAFACMAVANIAMKLDEYTQLLLSDQIKIHLQLIHIIGDEDNRNQHVAASALYALCVLARPMSDGSETKHSEMMVEASAIDVTIGCLSRLAAYASVQKNGRALLTRLGYEYVGAEDDGSEEKCVIG